MSKEYNKQSEDRTNDKSSVTKAKPNSNSRTNKGNSRNKKRRDRDFDKGLDTRNRDNDPNWYFTDKSLAEQAAQLSFQEMLGSGPALGDYRIPTLMVCAMNPCPGNSYQINEPNVYISDEDQVPPEFANGRVEDQDGINLMAAKTYSLLSSYSGRTSQYGPDDIAIMELAIAEVASISEHIRRAFGLALTYNTRNRSMPLEVLTTLGFEATDLLANLANYRMRFNIAMTRINQIPLLNNIGYIRKCRDMYQRIYVDSGSVMAQMYAFVPGTTWVLDEDRSETGGVLTTTTAYRTPEDGDGLVNMDQWLDLLEDMISRLLGSSTLNIIYSDLINLASKIKVEMWNFDYLSETYMVLPEYNLNTLLQIHNMDIVPSPRYDIGIKEIAVPGGVNVRVTPSNDVWANVTKVQYCPAFKMVHPTSGRNVGYHDTLVDMLTDNPSLEDRIESLRFGITRSGWHAKVGDDAAKSDLFLSLPDHYCTSIAIYNAAYYVRTVQNTTSYPDVQATRTQMDARMLSALTLFDFAPLLYEGNNSTDTVPGAIKRIYGDLNFFTKVGYQYMTRLNRLMFTGLFDFRV